MHLQVLEIASVEVDWVLLALGRRSGCLERRLFKPTSNHYVVGFNISLPPRCSSSRELRLNVLEVTYLTFALEEFAGGFASAGTGWWDSSAG